jgi:Rrf2 family iron-sulfur cluster assembly transcriptional regulator
MKITAQEEYGIRLLLRIANNPHSEGITIPQLSEQEGLSAHYVAKICRNLRLAGFIKSTRGKEGGYLLAYPAEQISLNQVLTTLGGKLYSLEFCQNHSGVLKKCSHSYSCEIQSVWRLVQQAVDEVLNRFTLQDLLNSQKNKHDRKSVISSNDQLRESIPQITSK